MNKLKFILFNIVAIVILIALVDLVSLVVLNLNSSEPDHHVITESVINSCYDDVSWGLEAITEWRQTSSKYKAFVGWRRLPYDGKSVQIDSNGIRKTEQSKTYQKYLPKTVFLGGSTIWGSGVNNSNTIPSLYAKLSNSLNPVVNYGETGYNAIQSYSFLTLNFIQGLDADLIISYDGVNNSPAHTSKMFTHSREEQIIGQLEGLDAIDKYRFSNYILHPTRALLSKVKTRLTRPDTPQKAPVSKSRNHEAAKELLDTWQELLTLANSKGARFYCILQPNVFYGNPDIGHLPKSIADHYYASDYQYYDTVRELINTPTYETLAPYFIDLTSALDDVPNVYIDFCHLNHHGNKIITKKIIEFIEDSEIKKISQQKDTSTSMTQL